MKEDDKKTLLTNASNFITKKIAQTLDDAKTVIAVSVGQLVTEILAKVPTEVEQTNKKEETTGE